MLEPHNPPSVPLSELKVSPASTTSEGKSSQRDSSRGFIEDHGAVRDLVPVLSRSQSVRRTLRFPDRWGLTGVTETPSVVHSI